MALTPLGDGHYVADGGKYYIGNANQAGIVSTFGKNSETGDYVFLQPIRPIASMTWSRTWWTGKAMWRNTL